MGMLDRLNVINEEELKDVVGGINVSGTLVKAFSTGINTILEVGRSLGSAIRRVLGRNLC